MTTKKTGLELLREPFPSNQISELPKPTKQQTDAVRTDFKMGIRCSKCGAWHHKDVVHLSYVGHAALTDRLLDCDPQWNWEPLGFDQDGQPLIKNNTMWIRLTVCGVSRLGFGDAADKTGPNAIKEIIGDALRNAAMRFGAALDLWHKGELHVDEEIKPAPNNERPAPKQPNNEDLSAQLNYNKSLAQATTIQGLELAWTAIPKEMQHEYSALKDSMKAKLSPKTVAA
jgi:hypothetical protein